MIIETTAPISIDNIKRYFNDKSISFLIDYDNSEIKGSKFLNYVSNIDIPCDIKINNVDELIDDYTTSKYMVSIKSLEVRALELLLEGNGLNGWMSILKSLTVYNMSTICDESIQEWIKTLPKNDDDVGVNFVNLLKYDAIYEIITNTSLDECSVYDKYFNKYIYNNKNLYEYWSVDNNPLFMLTFGIASGEISAADYITAKQKSIEELGIV